MGMTTTTETQGKAGAQSAEAGRAIGRMDTLSADAMSQLGDLSNIANGKFELTPEQLQYLQQVQQSAGDMGRIQMDENMQMATRGIEDTAIGRQNTGGSFEAISQALLGQQQLRDANRQSIQQEGQTAQNMLNMPIQYGQAQIQGNQALLARLVQGAGQTLQYDQGIRDMNSSQTKTETTPMAGMAMNLAAEAGMTYATGGFNQIAKGVQGNPYGNGTFGPMQ